ncbi:hypothetical protein L914_09260 [Phytophthora nicotianae]|uniref:Uncharacterized protein n=2 Tax=Phytophthora nicotianae TaxID=4792 RepID=V9F388_PHYNI|nr:hypothetical protein F443_09603 [Phytophthora nicotianae P1569]ETM45751.1 hypothetical protein L914_09260 [Phytophthora nicotianae]
MEDHEVDEESVWSNFDKSVAYMKEVASLYESAFGCKADGPSSTNRKTVTKAHLDEAQNQAQQALELLASNLLNASTTIVNSIEKQESEADRLKHKVSAIRQTIRDRQVALDQEAISKFYSSHKANQIRMPMPTSSARSTSMKQQRTLSSVTIVLADLT